MAGSEIDTLFGAKLGLSTLAAAGLGNMVSDVAGVSMANRIEVSFQILQRSVLAMWTSGSVNIAKPLGLQPRNKYLQLLMKCKSSCYIERTARCLERHVKKV